MNTDDFIDLTLGKPWEDRATGPDKYDCMGLVIDFYSKVKEVDINILGFSDGSTGTDDGYNNEKDKWIKLDTPKDGCLFAAFSGDICRHYGIYYNNYCLHANGQDHISGQVTLNKLVAVKRLFDKVEFWDYANNSNT